MTTTSAPRPGETASPANAGDPHRGSLFRAEMHRFTARRFIRVLLIGALVAFLGLLTWMVLGVFNRVDAADLAQAEQRRDQALAQNKQGWEMCLEEAGEPPPGVTREEMCGPEPTIENHPISDFTSATPFVLADYLPGGSVVVGSLTAALAFLIGATYVGAEWSTRSMVALLFWEPRRLRVIGVKLLVTALTAGLIGAAAQLVWTAGALLLARTRGTTSGLPADFWRDVLAQQGRCVLLVMLMALLGFGLANLIRNTGASLGVAFVYTAVVENIIRIVRPAWQEWLITDNIFALLSENGRTIYVQPGVGQDQSMPPREVLLSNAHGGLVLVAICAVVVGLGVILFKRRDLH